MSITANYFVFLHRMKTELSILIPTYNDPCVVLVSQLQQQAGQLSATGLRYEIIVADDCSTDESVVQTNAKVEQTGHCRLIRPDKNLGRAAIRNFLAKTARYEWLLFVDGDMQVNRHDFLERYLQDDSGTVVYGGYTLGDGSSTNLRYLYEKSCENQHTVDQRKKHPNKDFHTSNFLVRRSLFLSHPLNEEFLHYGYEDVVWGKTLNEQGINITHIDNPVCFVSFENNQSFIEKTEEGLRTLHQFSEELKSDSRLLQAISSMSLMRAPARWLFQIGRKAIRKRLCGKHPSLALFHIYRIGYYLTL